MMDGSKDDEAVSPGWTMMVSYAQSLPLRTICSVPSNHPKYSLGQRKHSADCYQRAVPNRNVPHTSAVSLCCSLWCDRYISENITNMHYTVEMAQWTKLSLVRHNCCHSKHTHQLGANQQQECALQQSLVPFKPTHKTLCNPLHALT